MSTRTYGGCAKKTDEEKRPGTAVVGLIRMDPADECGWIAPTPAIVKFFASRATP
jgi:hypothetical protein